jgi:hypothetical protein
LTAPEAAHAASEYGNDTQDESTRFVEGLLFAVIGGLVLYAALAVVAILIL